MVYRYLGYLAAVEGRISPEKERFMPNVAHVRDIPEKSARDTLCEALKLYLQSQKSNGAEVAEVRLT